MRIKNGLALCGCILALSACDYLGKGNNDPQSQAGPSRKLDALIDAELAAMRLSLPQKMADEFDMTDTRRVGKDVTYTYQFNTQEHKASTFDAEAGKQVAIPELCNTKATREATVLCLPICLKTAQMWWYTSQPPIAKLNHKRPVNATGRLFIGFAANTAPIVRA
jgi:hypothetical protein